MRRAYLGNGLATRAAAELKRYNLQRRLEAKITQRRDEAIRAKKAKRA